MEILFVRWILETLVIESQLIQAKRVFIEAPTITIKGTLNINMLNLHVRLLKPQGGILCRGTGCLSAQIIGSTIFSIAPSVLVDGGVYSEPLDYDHGQPIRCE
jgi:hypothetical protein